MQKKLGGCYCQKKKMFGHDTEAEGTDKHCVVCVGNFPN